MKQDPKHVEREAIKLVMVELGCNAEIAADLLSDKGSTFNVSKMRLARHVLRRIDRADYKARIEEKAVTPGLPL